MASHAGSLLLFPLPIGELSGSQFETDYFKNELKSTKIWVAENARTLRRYISALQLGVVIDELNILELSYQTNQKDLEQFLEENSGSQRIGLCSEAGLPCIADPGNHVVTWAQRKNWNVIPLIGPNSIVMALQGSGFNGQQFVFHGYFPLKEDAIRQWHKEFHQSFLKKYTHIFIETPYRSDKTFRFLLKTLTDNTKLCVAAGLHMEEQNIKTQTVAQWKRNVTEFGKTPVVFVISN
jgi:16S rRNA (cytidine1402-2'-O)-methyltransferase